jgi:hypothetical protein
MITATQLQPFCADPDDQSTRPVIHNPYVRHGKTYATDGRIAIRVFHAVPDVERNDNGPNADSVIDPIPSNGLWFKPSLADGVGEEHPCPMCKGEAAKICEACNGDGEVEWTFRDHTAQYMCPLCQGEGSGCDECNGNGMVPDDTPVKMGLNWYKAFYLRKVMALPDAELCGGDINEPARIRFDGGDGGLMPLDVQTWNDRCKACGHLARMIVVEGSPK